MFSRPVETISELLLQLQLADPEVHLTFFLFLKLLLELHSFGLLFRQEPRVLSVFFSQGLSMLAGGRGFFALHALLGLPS
jgi:hypothetical protein